MNYLFLSILLLLDLIFFFQYLLLHHNVFQYILLQHFPLEKIYEYHYVLNLYDDHYEKTVFEVELKGENSSTKVTSRSVATDDSVQEFVSNVIGNNVCFGHVECDAIIKDNARVIAEPKIIANNIEANLIHEAAIGKIAGDQLTKLMTLGLSEKEAEDEIIKGFLK